MRLNHHKTQRELAELAGLAYSTYRSIEDGRVARPKYGQLKRIAKALGVEVEDICQPEWLQ